MSRLYLLLALLIILFSSDRALRAQPTFSGSRVRIVDSTGTNTAFVDATGALKTTGGGGGGGGTAMVDESAMTEGATNFTPAGGVFNDIIGSPTSGQGAMCRITSARGLHVNLRNASGTEIGTASNPVRTDPTGTTPQPVSGTVGVNNFPANQPTTDTPATVAAVTAAWTSATGAGAILGPLAVLGSSIALLNVDASTTASATSGTLNFEVSDDSGTTWKAATQAARLPNNADLNAGSNVPVVANTYTFTDFLGNQRYVMIPVAGFTNVRVRLTGILSGMTGTINLRMQATSAPMIPPAISARQGEGDLNIVQPWIVAGTVTTNQNQNAPDLSAASIVLSGLNQQTTPVQTQHGQASTIFYVSAGSGTLTLSFEMADTNGNFIPATAIQLQAGNGGVVGTFSTSVVNPGSTEVSYLIPTSGAAQIRARISAFTSGQVSVGWDSSTGSPWQPVTRVTDGTNFQAVKAGSTAAGAADPSAVVALSPNSPLPAGAAIIGALSANQSVNVAQVGGTNTVNGGLAGTLGIGGANANNTAISQNPDLVGAEALSSQPVAASTGNVRRLVSDLDGSLFVRQGGPVLWSCSLDNIGATLTQCQAAPGAGLKLYLTDVVVGSTTAAAGQFLIRYGTGANCVTGTTSLFPAAATVVRYGYPANTVNPNIMSFTTPLFAAANNAICVLCVVTNTCTVQLSGFTAP